jgi:hypothetical protein
MQEADYKWYYPEFGIKTRVVLDQKIEVLVQSWDEEE